MKRGGPEGHFHHNVCVLSSVKYCFSFSKNKHCTFQYVSSFFLLELFWNRLAGVVAIFERFKISGLKINLIHFQDSASIFSFLPWIRPDEKCYLFWYQKSSFRNLTNSRSSRSLAFNWPIWSRHRNRRFFENFAMWL